MHIDLSHQSSLDLSLTHFSLKSISITPYYLTSMLLVGAAFHGTKSRWVVAAGSPFCHFGGLTAVSWGGRVRLETAEAQHVLSENIYNPSIWLKFCLTSSRYVLEKSLNQ